MVSTLVRVNGDIPIITLDNDGNILIANYSENCIERIDPRSGSTYAFPKCIDSPRAITVSLDGTVYVSSQPGIISYWNGDNWKEISRNNKEVNALKVDSFGNVFFVDSRLSCIKKISSSGEETLFAGSVGDEGNVDGLLSESRFDFPYDIAVNRNSIYISDNGNHTIRKISLLCLWNKGKGW